MSGARRLEASLVASALLHALVLGVALRGARVTLLHFQDGAMRVDYKNRSLAYTHFKTNPGSRHAESEKTLDARLDQLIAATAAPSRSEPITAQGCG